MPRLNRSKYFMRHKALSHLWDAHRQLFSLLSPTAQLELHQFYLPTVDIIEHELASYRQYINAREPSLAHRAGKHFALLTRRSRHASTTISSSGTMSVRPIMKPTPDAKKLARAFMLLADTLRLQ